MIEYRITKYNPKNRVNESYIVDEWTSISDIGKEFDAGVLTYEEYKKVEQSYVDCCIAILQAAKISELAVCNPEYYDNAIRFPQLLRNENDVRWVVMCCLQEKCWAKLETKNFFVHFGYDYYMYVGTNLSLPLVAAIAEKYSLFCECFASPYSSSNSNSI